MDVSAQNLQQELYDLQECYELQREKINRLRKAFIIETDESIRFKYEKDIERAKAERTKIKEEIKCIEKELDIIKLGFIVNPIEELIIEYLVKNSGLLDELLLTLKREKPDSFSLLQNKEVIASIEEYHEQDVIESSHLLLLTLETDFSLERRKLVEQNLLKAFIKNPKSVEVLNNLAALESNLGHPNIAKHALEMALEYLPMLPKEQKTKAEFVIRSNLVKIYSEIGPYIVEAVNNFERTLFSEREAKNLKVQDNRLIQLGWGMECGDSRVPGLFVPPTLVVPRRYAGYAYLYQGMIKEAIEQFKLSVAKNPKNVDSLVGLSFASNIMNSNSLQNRGYLDMARQQLEDFYDKNEVKYHHYLAHVFAQLRKYDDAVACIKKVGQIEPAQLFFTAQEPSFYDLHADSGFKSLISKLPTRPYPQLDEILKQLKRD